MKSILSRMLLSVLIPGIVMTTACGDDDSVIPKGPPVPAFKNLVEKGDVLTNFELAYNQRRIDKYDQVLDANFTFFLSPEDVGGGLPSQWDRTMEVLVNMRLLDKNNATLPCQSISLDVRTKEGVTWTPFNPTSAPVETWYRTTLFYSFEIQINANTFIPPPEAKLEFVVRDAGPSGANAHHWQLVELHDLGGSTLFAVGSTSIEGSTLGKVKALYR